MFFLSFYSLCQRQSYPTLDDTIVVGVKNKTNAIEQTVNVQTTEKNVAIYDINGIKQVKQKKGINLMKMSNGTTKKFIIK